MTDQRHLAKVERLRWAASSLFSHVTSVHAALGRHLASPYLASSCCDTGVLCHWFADDYLKFIKARSKGLFASQKFTAQIVVALIVALILYSLPGYSTKLSVPFFKSFTPDLRWFYIVFAVLVIVGCSNAVNLTDGLDGLAIGPVMIAALAYTLVAYVTGHRLMSEYLLIPHIDGAGELAVFTAAILGSSLGFLWFNTIRPRSLWAMSVRSRLGQPLGRCGHQQA